MTNLPKHKKSLLILAFSIGIAFSSGFNYVSHQSGRNTDASTKQTEFPSKNQVPYSNSVEYVRLELGMSIAQAQALLGAGTELSKTTSETQLIWRISNSSSVTAIFRDGKLASKNLEVVRACYINGQKA